MYELTDFILGNYIRVGTDFILKDNLDNYFLKQKL